MGYGMNRTAHLRRMSRAMATGKPQVYKDGGVWWRLFINHGVITQVPYASMTRAAVPPVVDFTLLIDPAEFAETS